ncbi:MAG TPA: efflux RND transporter periplasmic adaptor subunit [Kofleriaceae bacterium]|nr:efflux RND transporter periplasmic adaptor subunit [Kofleriaceae bacterium]
MKRLVIVLALASCNPGADRAIDPAAAAAQPTPVAKNDRKSADTEPVGYVGVLAPRESIEVTSPFTTKVQKLYVNLGDTVNAGEPLALLDDRPLREELAIAKAQYKEAAISAGAAANKYARERLALKEQVTSKANVAAAGFESGKAGATVEQHKARVAQLEQRLKETTLTAQIGGKVALRYVEEGARVTEGQPVVRVISSDELFVKFAIPAEDARKLAPGSRIEIRFEGKSPTAEGIVRTVAPELDPVAQMILAEAELVNATAELQSGLVCRIVAKPGAAAPPPPPPKREPASGSASTEIDATTPATPPRKS